MSIVSDETGRIGQAVNASRTTRLPPDTIPGIVHVVELLAMLGVGALFCTDVMARTPEYLSQHVFSVLFVLVTFSWTVQWGGMVTLNALMRPVGNGDRLVVAVLTSFLFLLSILYGFDQAYIFSNSWLLRVAAGSIAAVFTVRLLAFALLRHLSEARVIGRRLAVLAPPAQASDIVRRIMRDQPYFSELTGVFLPADEQHRSDVGGIPVLGGLQDLVARARQGLIDDVIVARSGADLGKVNALDHLRELPINIFLATELVEFDLKFSPMLGKTSQLPLFSVTQRPISGWSSATKRILDYTLSAAALLVLSPLLLFVALCIKLNSRGPVFFMQKRLGFNNEPFEIYKFRSMYHDRDDGEVVRQATKGDPRVTAVGRIIRSTSIDELPQLLNVLNGTMSLVGPRPHALSHNVEYGEQIRGYFARHKVKPGITGWAQVNGLRGETPNIELMRKRVEHDVFYTENWSIFFDMKIIVMTIVVVLLHKSAY